MQELLKKQLEFMIEIDKLKRIERRTRNIHNSRYENDAEHSWHLAVMAMVLQEHANEEVDLLKVIKMLLIHDLVEIDAGDTFAYDTKGHEDKLEREMKAAKRIFGMLPEEQEQQFLALWLEFEQKETSEAKFAAALDRLQPLIHNYMNQGETWRQYEVTSDRVIQRNQEIANGSAELWDYAHSLIQEAVEKGYFTQ